MAFWRQEDPILSAKGHVKSGGMWCHQRDWWNLDNYVRALVTGYGGGKTLIGCKRAISLALQNAPAPHINISPSYRIAKRTVIPTLKRLLRGKQTLYPGLQWDFNQQDMEFRIKLGDKLGTIWIVSGDNPDSMKGPNVGSANIDEPFLQDREVFDQVLARVRHPEANRREINLLGTPEDLNWGYDVCEGDERENFDIGIVTGSTRDNLALPENYITTLEKALTERAAQSYIDGIFVSLTEGLVYYGFGNHNIQDLPFPSEDYPICAGMDFNVDPMAAAIFWQKGDHIHYFDEIQLPNSDTEFMCSEFRDRYGQRLQDVYPDPTGRARNTSSMAGVSDFSIIRNMGFTLNARTFYTRKDRYNATNGKLKPKDGPPSITVSPKCKKLIHYFRNYSFKNMNKQKEMSHLLDAATYPIINLFPIRRHSGHVAVTGT